MRLHREMDLASIFSDLRLEEESEKSTGVSGCLVIRVLSAISQRFSSAPDSEKRSILRSAEVLLSSREENWLFPDCDFELKEVYVELVSCFITYAALPVCDTDGGTLPHSSYAHIPAKAQEVGAALLALTVQLRGATSSTDPTLSGTARSLNRTLGPNLCVFSITHLQDQPWTDHSSRRCALELLESIVKTTGCRTVLELLCGKAESDQRGMLGPILDTLQPELTKENWKRNQAVKHVFSWLLVQVGRPWLADYLEKVFPPSLLISDDYRNENKVLGVHCLHHIVLNVPAADLRQFNRAQVLYHALFNHLYTSEAELIQVALPCLIDLLPVLEKPLRHAEFPRKPNRFDDVLRLILTHMEMEHKLALRRIYARNLLLFIEKMGIGIARHLKRLERVIVGYLEVSDGPEEEARLSILEVLERTVQTAWPRMECRVDVLAKSLLRFLVDISSESLDPDLRDKLMTKATHCLLLLDQCTHGKLLVLLKEVDSSCVSDRVLKCLQSLTAP